MVEIVIGQYVMVETDPEKVGQVASEDQSTALVGRPTHSGELSDGEVVDSKWNT